MRYKDLDTIGSGGFGEVYRCQRASDNTVFAKKVLTERDNDSIARFRREVRLLESLDHPNIVSVVAKRLEEPPFYFVMPLYAGSLHSHLPTLKDDLKNVHKVFSHVLSGVAYAHAEGVIHRDLKVRNILLNGVDDVVVSDLGLGKRIDGMTDYTTKPGLGFGSHWYTAPEQWTDAKNVAEPADVFGLGRILWAILAGEFTPSSALESSPRGLRFIVERCTQDDPSRRYQSVSQLQTAFNAFFAATVESSTAETLDGLVKKAASPGLLTPSELSSLCNLVHDAMKSGDFAHEFLMKLDSTHVHPIEEHDIVFFRQLIDTFAKNTREGSYGFSYTDKIASQCQSLFNASDDPHVRAVLIVTVMDVGVHHNRWTVMQSAGSMIEATTKPEDVVALLEALEAYPPGVSKHISPYIKIERFQPQLRRRFASPD